MIRLDQLKPPLKDRRIRVDGKVGTIVQVLRFPSGVLDACAVRFDDGTTTDVMGHDYVEVVEAGERAA